VQGDIDSRASTEAAEAVAERAEAAGDRSGAMLARALVLLNRMSGGELVGVDEQVELCRAALPLEEERGDPRRLALLWEMLGLAANFRMQNDDDVYASQQALRYRRLAGDSPTETRLEWPLILGPRPADEAMRMLDELDAWRPPGATDLPRAALLAMLGGSDEAWPLAEARSSYVREVSGNRSQEGHLYLWLIATIEGDRERACRHNADMIEVLGDSVSVAAAFWSFQARELCYLGRPDEAEPWLRQAQAVPPRASVRVMAPPPRRSSSQRAASSTRQRRWRAQQSPGRRPRRTMSGSRAVHAKTSRPCSSALAGSTRHARRSSALELWERKRCLPCAERVREQIDSLGRAKV
jgi:hypothetical protein